MYICDCIFHEESQNYQILEIFKLKNHFLK